MQLATLQATCPIGSADVEPCNPCAVVGGGYRPGMPSWDGEGAFLRDATDAVRQRASDPVVFECHLRLFFCV